MPFYLSPSVNVIEKDFTSIVPSVSTSTGAFAGPFSWGPVEDPTTISSENTLVARFGKPTDQNAASFYTAANFLAYSNNMLLIRTDAAGLKNAVADDTNGAVKIKNPDHYESLTATEDFGTWAARYPGSFGNSLKVSMADAASFAAWEYKNEFDGTPGTTSYAKAIFGDGSKDGLHIVVVDEDGLWTGAKGSILEKYAFLSKASDAVKSDGTNNYYKNVINGNSKYIWWMGHPLDTNTGATLNWGRPAHDAAFDQLLVAESKSLLGGADDYASTEGDISRAFSIFANDELYDISLLMCGKASANLARFIIQNVAETRKDCVAFCSPLHPTSGDIIQGNSSESIEAIVGFREALNLSSSYGIMDSGWKYQYDRYNDVYRWVPLNGDIAGLCARTDYTNDAWFSPAGYNRGQIKNVVKLATNPSKTDRDNLYKKGINPVVNFPGEGVVLFGDKTLLSTPSAFDRINVRRLFIVLEKAIATASKYSLFEMNDSFTRAQFKNMIEPFLRDVKGRRGVVDFRVKCDELNNTGEVIDRNEFIADIFIKPTRTINFITLNFVATRSSISFEELGA